MTELFASIETETETEIETETGDDRDELREEK
jgi:hypothetical protein